MRSLALLLVLGAWGAGVAAAQEDNPGAASPPPTPATRSYVVQFTEFRLQDSADPKLAAREIVQSFDALQAEGKLQVTETVRLSALEGCECMAQFGKQAAITVGVTRGQPAGYARQVQYQQVGTMVRVTAKAQQDRVALQLSYEASHLGESDADDRPPETSTIQYNTTLLLQPGAPALVGGSSAGPSSFLLVTLSEQPPQAAAKSEK